MKMPRGAHWGFPCCVRFPCVHAAATTPVQRLGVLFAHSPSRISLPRKGRRVGLHIVLFEACSAFTRVAACTLALSPIRDTLIEGFSHFVASMTAPIASGWSESPGGTYTHWKAPPCHGAHPSRTLDPSSREGLELVPCQRQETNRSTQGPSHERGCRPYGIR